jgi:signal transduction histidine kinase/CheY-like chemotaxis protein
MARVRRILREGALALAPDQVSLFLFDPAGGPVLRLMRYRSDARSFGDPDLHPGRMAREAGALLSSVSCVEVADLRQNAPPPGAMRDYLSAAGVQALLSLPLRHRERITGFLAFEVLTAPRKWTPADRDKAHRVARQVEGRLDDDFLAAAMALAPEGQVTPADPPASSGPGGSARSQTQVEGRRELRARLPRLRTLEGAALVGADLGQALLEEVQIQEGTLRLLEREMERLGGSQELVDDLRELVARLRSGLQRSVDVTRSGMVPRDVVDLGSVMGGMIQDLARIAGEEVHFVVAPSVQSLPVRADSGLLRRAVEHLVTNARRAVRKGGRIRLSWGRAPAQKELKADGAPPPPVDVARIQVEDDGAGVLPEHLPWIFEPYFTTAPGSAPAGGLGLATVQAVVEGHGGWIDLRSRPGEGTLVVLNLPLADVASGSGGSREQAPDEAEGARILVLEEDRFRGRFLRRVLEGAGYRVVVATSPDDAGRLWSDDPSAFAGVLLRDRPFGGDRGQALVRQWRRDRPDLAIIHLEHKGGVDPRSGKDELGGRELWLADPYDPEEILEGLRETLVSTSREEASRGNPSSDSASSPSGSLPPMAH